MAFAKLCAVGHALFVVALLIKAGVRAFRAGIFYLEIILGQAERFKQLLLFPANLGISLSYLFKTLFGSSLRKRKRTDNFVAGFRKLRLNKTELRIFFVKLFFLSSTVPSARFFLFFISLRALS